MIQALQFDSTGDLINTAFPAVKKQTSWTADRDVWVVGLYQSSGIVTDATAGTVAVAAILGEDATSSVAGPILAPPHVFKSGVATPQHAETGIAFERGKGVRLNKNQSISLSAAAPNAVACKVAAALLLFLEPV